MRLLAALVVAGALAGCAWRADDCVATHEGFVALRDAEVGTVADFRLMPRWIRLESQTRADGTIRYVLANTDLEWGDGCAWSYVVDAKTRLIRSWQIEAKAAVVQGVAAPLRRLVTAPQLDN